jgi:hypothetical protein
MSGAARASHFTQELVAGLDEPVRRYFSHAIRDGAPLAGRFAFSMAGRIKVNTVWLPFTADQESDRESFVWTARVGVGPLTVLKVSDRYASGAGLMEGRLFGRRTVFRADGQHTTRSAAARAALDACAFAPASVLPHLGVSWRAESAELIVASWELPPERPQVRIRIDHAGAIRAVSAERWDRKDTPDYQYIPCGGDIHAEGRFGDFTVPSRITVGWWYGTERYAPFFRAQLRDFVPVR